MIPNGDDNISDEADKTTRNWNFIDFLTSNSALFYYCALISSWDDRSWYFVTGVYLVIIDPTKLTMTAIFGFLSAGFILLFGSLIGSLIDRTPRLRASFVALTIRNVSILICSVFLGLVLFMKNTLTRSGSYETLKLISQINLIVFGVLAHAAGMSNNNMLHKDWLPILCAGDSHLLSKMNSRFRMIDLVSKIVAPVIIGQIITFAGRPVAAIIFAVQVMLTLMIFSILLKIIYERMPRLHYREVEKGELSVQADELTKINNDVNKQNDEISEPEPKSCDKFILILEGWIVYFKQSIVLPGFGLALLYMTVLGFDSVTIGYALSQGMTESVLSFFNAGAAITGIFGALIFPYVIRSTNVVLTGIIGLCFQLLGLMPCLASIWALGSPFNLANGNYSYNSTITPYNGKAWSQSLMLLMSGIMASRVGLWMYDLTISQLLVETVLEVNRGKVNGVQSSLNMLFDMIKFGLVLGFPTPRQFGLLVMLSVGSVSLGNLFYIAFAISNNCKIKSYL